MPINDDEAQNKPMNTLNRKYLMKAASTAL